MSKRPLVIPVLFLLLGCGGFLENSSDVTLGVPYYEQLQYNYCVPASIQMWRAYDGLTPFYSQSYIWQELGGPPCNGSDAELGVSIFTASGKDAFQDSVPGHYKNDFFARQITSIDNGVPVLVVVKAGYHAGILNGGQYHYDSNLNRYRWEFAYFHDPAFGADQYYTSDDWVREVCDPYCHQIISVGAIAGWDVNRDGYSVETYEGYGSEENQDGP